MSATSRDALPADGPALAAMGRQSFTETFGTLYAPADLAAFLDTTFGPAGLPAQLGDPAYRIRVATSGDAIVGFAKLGPVLFPGDWPADAIELHQLYALADSHGTGVGPLLMDWAIATARRMGCSALILSVYVDNHRARAFYARYGFVDIGRYDFAVGTHIDEDRIMRLTL
ncbi:acetyltransferase [Sphingomonas sp. Leaf17]|uniref:GNAT family N-acetyltransferase n=1 Tax=Sphingomonas sp. Leaf17 TaxID=1735683 RepID=UPI0006FB4168|nr:GNAT family N-acetyltransferase [Sphingomonas sp. Leaf17]KQM67572.1 acetyltransferase [Sphingomonas sp. Leaf17]